MKFNRQEVICQIQKLHEKFSGLHLVLQNKNEFIISGLLAFSVKHHGEEFRDVFNIEISVPSQYPDLAPAVKEIEGRIPRKFHQFKYGELCLAVPLEIKSRLLLRPTLLEFVEEFIVPYLFSFCYQAKYKVMPFGERKHGGEGILEYYQELFNIIDPIAILGMVRILAEDDYRGHLKCPCLSGQLLRNCHGPSVLGVKKYQEMKMFLDDYYGIEEYLLSENIFIPRGYLVQKKGMKSQKKRNRKKQFDQCRSVQQSVPELYY